MIMNMPKFIITSIGWSYSGTTIQTGTIGHQAIIFNQRFACRRLAIILCNNDSSG